MGVLHSFSIKNIFYDKMDLRLFYLDVVKYENSLFKIPAQECPNKEILVSILGIFILARIFAEGQIRGI